jgi:hypothetical protein
MLPFILFQQKLYLFSDLFFSCCVQHLADAQSRNVMQYMQAIHQYVSSDPEYSKWNGFVANFINSLTSGERVVY